MRRRLTFECGSSRRRVSLAAFKAVVACLRGTGGGFDSHELPPFPTAQTGYSRMCHETSCVGTSVRGRAGLPTSNTRPKDFECVVSTFPAHSLTLSEIQVNRESLFCATSEVL